MEYFKTLADVKKIVFIKDIDDNISIFIDEKKISKLIDNLLSNAIKYNKIEGFIKITLKKNSLIIEDSGKGMTKEELENLFIRYKRFDKTVGGFGIGLNIVSMIAKEYNLKVIFSSNVNKGTKVEIKWQD